MSSFQSAENHRKKCQRFWLRLNKSLCDPDFERSNVSFKESKRDVIDPNSNGLDYCVQKNEGKIIWFLAGCFIFLVSFPNLMT